MRAGLLRFRGSLAFELHAEASALDDGVVAELLPHRVQRLVDAAVGRSAAEQVALGGPPRLDQIVGADADQAEGAAVGLAGKQRLGRPEHLLRRLRGAVQAARAGGAVRNSAVLSFSVTPRPAKPAFFIRRATVSASRHRIGRGFSRSATSSSRVISEETLFASRSGSTERSSSPRLNRNSRRPISP